jgi:hypothetical protein
MNAKNILTVLENKTKLKCKLKKVMIDDDNMYVYSFYIRHRSRFYAATHSVATHI